jgi:hypothetical protein
LTANKSFLEQVLSNWPAKALSLAAAIMLFILHNFSSLSERYISVELHAVFAEGLTAAQPYPHRVRVEIRGNDRILTAATEEDIEAVADFSRFSGEGVYTTPITIQMRGVLEGVDAIEIQVDPLELTLPVEKKVRKRVDVIPVFKGLPATGYRLDQYAVTPAGVDLEGPWGIIQSIQSVSTEDIDLSGKRETFSARVRLINENSLLTFPGGDTVDFRGQILESVAMKTFADIDIAAQGLRGDWSFAAAPPVGWITLQGGQLALETQRREWIQLVVECGGIAEPGLYSLPVKAVIPSGLTVVQFDPPSVSVEIRRIRRDGQAAP